MLSGRERVAVLGRIPPTAGVLVSEQVGRRQRALLHTPVIDEDLAAWLTSDPQAHEVLVLASVWPVTRAPTIVGWVPLVRSSPELPLAEGTRR